MDNNNLNISTFIRVLSTTKNLSLKILLAYRSDLNDFIDYVREEKICNTLVLEYFSHLKERKNLRTHQLNVGSLQLKSIAAIYLLIK